MIQTVFTRKNLIAIAISIFYSLILLFTGLCLDPSGAILNKKNPIAAMGKTLGFRQITPGMLGYLILILVAFYIIVCATALIYEKRYAVVNKIKPFSKKMILIYSLTVVLSLLLSVGFGILCQRPLTAENIGNMLMFLLQSLGLGTGLFLLLFLLVGAATMLVVNFLNIDKPFKFFGEEEEPVFDDEDLQENHDISSSFDIDAEADVQGGGAGGAGGNGGGAGGFGEGGEGSVSTKNEIGDREKVFPTLSKLDAEHEGYEIDQIACDDLSLDELCEQFRNYLAKEEKLYFDIDVIRFFISGFAASHFEILEGLSGTGKSSLPRYFAKFTNSRVLFMPVQTTWRDKSNILGFFNEFSNTYSETDFLVELYHANYNPDELHMFVLDEMNISRVEYYFADLLSVLEFPKDEWKLKVMTLPYDFIPPIKLEDGYIRIPTNTYFVGTANKDDSTYTITDKVYDRAITTEFENKNTPFTVDGKSDKIHLSASGLHGLYEKALATEENAMNEEDYQKLNTVCEYVYDQFGIAIGNRIMNQIATIVPVFVACGGTKESAIDFMIAKKLIAKVEGRFEEYVKDALANLLKLLNTTYGNGVMKRCELTANAIMRTL